MKKILIFLALILNGQWSMVNGQNTIAESNDRVIVPITAGRNIPYVAYSGTLRVEAATEWKVSSSAEWLTAEKTADGLRFVATANTGDNPRTATLTLTSTDGKVTRTVNITQDSEKASADIEGKVNAALSKMSLTDKVNLIVGENTFYTSAINSIGLPRLFMSDGPQGVRTTAKSTAYPTTVVLAATWNTDLAYDYGRALGRDSRARGIQYILGPGVNIYRSPRGGRNFEYMGEDPWLTSQLACGYIKGVQSNPGVICMIKHFAANFMEYGRLNTSSDVDERTLQEIYLPAFRRAAQDAKVGSIMSGYNLVNGVYCCEDSTLMQTILRRQWHYPFMTVSDWGAPYYAKGSGWNDNHVLDLLDHGVDHEAATPGYYQIKLADVQQYIADGRLTEDRLDLKVRDILRTIYYFHLDEYIDADKTIPLDNAENAAVAYRTAAEGIVLLKNADNILPLDAANVKKVGVIGHNAQGYICGSGSGLVEPFHYVSALQGLQTVGKDKGIEVQLIDFSDAEPIANRDGKEYFFTDEACTTPGWSADYYKNKSASGTVHASRVDQLIDNPWEAEPVSGLGDSNFSAVWTAYFKCQYTGKYTFAYTADDGMDLTLDGTKIIDDWKDNAEHTKTATQNLQAGEVYKIVARYYQAGGGAVARLAISSDNPNYKAQQQALLGSLDAIIVCEGFDGKLEGENIDRTFALPTERQQMITTATRTGKPVIVVLNSGGAISMTSWLSNVKGILWAGYPGQEGGTALADIIFGNVNPSGKLPMTFERLETDNPTYNYYNATNRRVQFKEGIYVGYRGYQKNNKVPLFPFGFGLSYTTFEVSDLQANPTSATVTVKNTGSRAGSEVVQVYIGPAQGGAKESGNGQWSIDRPARELRGFAKVSLQPGESKTIEIPIDDHAYSYFDVSTHSFQQLPGTYKVFAGTSSGSLPLQTTVTVD
ncbi:MAG: glycoside hydrolase family 3 C-terminal domain-containing protein [Bacteroidaceae bacterium]|nr:glycoside hydrolase family 3 C-terminal domain-containing protein [Bacteroidaceae bacterium]